jgi:membrane associated rhomboid family serine protease
METGIYTNMGKKLRNIIIFVALLYGLWLLDWIIFGVEFSQFGIQPRTVKGLIGIFTAPLIHANIYHLFSNTLPLIVLLSLFSFAYPNKVFPAISIIVLLGGLLVWVFARSASHVGASGLIYGLATFLIIHGFLSRDFKNIILSIIVLVAYGGLVWGLLPSATRWWVSFEGHLFGAISGGFAAYLLRTKKEKIEKPEQGI